MSEINWKDYYFLLATRIAAAKAYLDTDHVERARDRIDSAVAIVGYVEEELVGSPDIENILSQESA